MRAGLERARDHPRFIGSAGAAGEMHFTHYPRFREGVPQSGALFVGAEIWLSQQVTHEATKGRFARGVAGETAGAEPSGLCATAWARPENVQAGLERDATNLIAGCEGAEHAHLANPHAGSGDLGFRMKVEWRGKKFGLLSHRTNAGLAGEHRGRGF